MDSRTRAVGWLLVAGQFALLLGLLVTPRRAPSLGWAVVGGALVLAGLGLAAWAMVRLGDALTPTPVPRDRAALRTDGPYARIRHPIYSGLLLAATGYVIAVGTWSTVAILAALLTFFRVKARFEDRLLAQAHESEWPDWATRTGALVPRMRRRGSPQ